MSVYGKHLGEVCERHRSLPLSEQRIQGRERPERPSWQLETAVEDLATRVASEFRNVQQAWPGGISHREIALRCHKSRPQVTNFLAAKGNPTLRLLAAVADALDCDVQVRLCPRPKGEVPIEDYDCDETEAAA